MQHHIVIFNGSVKAQRTLENAAMMLFLQMPYNVVVGFGFVATVRTLAELDQSTACAFVEHFLFLEKIDQLNVNGHVDEPLFQLVRGKNALLMHALIQCKLSDHVDGRFSSVVIFNPWPHHFHVGGVISVVAASNIPQCFIVNRIDFYVGTVIAVA